MCGIIGCFSKNKNVPDRNVFENAVDSMSHRGPDGRGIWMGEKSALGFRRLSIIDLKTGDQPMSNEQGTLHLVFNGEIYNFKELRKELESKGYRFRTQSDTETILHLYEELGDSCVHRLRGMFAFAIYDQNKNRLFLACDRFGKKPLFYTETPHHFYFASEIRALLQFKEISREVDSQAIDAYLSLNYTPGDRTAWRYIQRLPAAHTLEVLQGNPESPKRYWQIQASENNLSEPEALEKFRALFEESVKMRMISDVPLGAFLSGGVDSSLTVAAMTQLGGKIQTFCIGFAESRFDESKYAQQAAHFLGTDHHELKVAADSLDMLDPLLDELGEPFADHSLLPTFHLSKFTKQHVTVALSGDGGDELFGGYKRYRHLLKAEALRNWNLEKSWQLMSRWIFTIEKLLNPRRRALQWPRSGLDQILNLEPIHQYLRLVGSWNDENRRSLWKHKPGKNLSLEWIQKIFHEAPTLHGLQKWQILDLQTYLTDDILRKVDVASMAASLECRCPFLDHTVVEFAINLPSKFKINRLDSKILLKNLYPKLLPPSFFNREKKGFSMPIGLWMKNQWKEIVRDSIEGTWQGEMDQIFDRKILRHLWTEHLAGTQDHSSRLWSWLVLSRWNNRFTPKWNG